MSPEEIVNQCQTVMAHAWMVRTFIKHSDEVENFPELMGIVRAVFDASRALETRVGDPAAYLHMLGKKIGKLRQAAEQFRIDAAEASTHTNFQQAVISMDACVRQLQDLLNVGRNVLRRSPAFAKSRASETELRRFDGMETHARTTRRRRISVAPPTYVEEADEPDELPDVPAWLAISRAVALFFGAFTLLNVFGEIQHPGFDANIWWIDLRPVPVQAARGVLSFAAMLLISFALKPTMSVLRRRLSIAVVLTLFGAALWNAFVFYAMWRRGQISTHFAVPFSLHVAASLAVIVAGLVANTEGASRPFRDFVLGAFTLVVCLVGFPIAQMSSFGNTDYRREADVIVVFGCRAYADGTPSSALMDRVIAGCELYQQGLAPKLILTGGPGDNNVAETEVMRAEAIKLGVPEAAIIVDPHGDDTQASVKNTVALFDQLGARRVLAVSHFYHLPRVKLAYHRAGVEVFTVPAKQQQPLQKLLEFELREVGALWYYYLEPLLQSKR